MGRRLGARRAHPAPFYAPADLVLSRRYQNGAGRNRRATQPPAHFQRNPQGRGRLAVFLRCSLGPYRSREWALRSRLEKQPTDPRRNQGDLEDGALGRTIDLALPVVLVSEGSHDSLAGFYARRLGKLGIVQASYARPAGGMRHGFTAVERRLFLIGPGMTALCLF